MSHECIGECDCCGQGDRHLRQVWFSGMETWACAECRGEDPDADLDDEPDGDDYADRAAWEAMP